MPHVNGVIETALYVADPQRSVEFYTRVLGFRPILEEGDRLKAMSVADRHVLLLFKLGGSEQPTDTPGGRIPQHDGRGQVHVAFAIDPAEVEPWARKLEQEGVVVESRVDVPRGGHSLYFRDPDGHLVELVTPGCWEIY